MADFIRIDGLADFSRKLRKVDTNLAKGLRLALNDAAGIVVDAARPEIPRRTGRAEASVKARSTRTQARVSGGGNRAPYYPWLDFGGRVGRNRSVERPFLKEGRYIYQGYFDRKEEIADRLQSAIVGVAVAAGLAVEEGGG
jgi:hypothetical protein